MNPHASNGDAPQGQLATTRANATASAGELQEFLQRLRGKDPREILGEITKSGLVRATVQATIGTLIVIVLFTVGPYLVDKQFPATAKATPKPAATTTPAAATPTPAATASAETPAATSASTSTPASTSPTANPTAVLNKLGENETKKASPKINPLDKKDDDLLKDLFNK